MKFLLNLVSFVMSKDFLATLGQTSQLSATYFLCTLSYLNVVNVCFLALNLKCLNFSSIVCDFSLFVSQSLLCFVVCLSELFFQPIKSVHCFRITARVSYDVSVLTSASDPSPQRLRTNHSCVLLSMCHCLSSYLSLSYHCVHTSPLTRQVTQVSLTSWQDRLSKSL